MAKIIRLTDKNGVVSNIAIKGPGPQKIKADAGTKVAIVDDQTGAVVENVTVKDTGSDIELIFNDGSEQHTVVLQDGDGSGIAVFGADGSALGESTAYTGTILVGDDKGNNDAYLYGALGALAIGGGIALLSDSKDKTPPAFTSGGTASPIAENAGAGKVIYTAAATDKSPVTYSLKSGAGDAALFSIDAKTGAVTLTGNPNFEAKAGYTFTVIATDAAGNAAEQVVTLAVTNLDEVAPTFTSGTVADAVVEGSGANKVVYTAKSTDTGDIATGSTTYSIKAGTGDAAKFSIDGKTGALTLLDNPNYDAKSAYSVTLVATDAAGNKSEQTVTLGVIYQNIVEVTVVGGPVLPTHGLTVGLYDGTGKLLQTAGLNSDGSVSVNLGTYRGAVIARVLQDTDTVADYLDEATGTGKDLGVDLFAVGALSGTSETLSLNVNVLSTLAYYKALEAANTDPFNGGELKADVINDTNDAIASLFGVQSLHNLPVVTVNGEKTTYNPNDSISPSEKYGEVLAALSGADKNNNGSTQATLDQLLNGIEVTGPDATFDDETYAMVNKGADTIDQTLNLSTLKSVSGDTNPTILDAKIVSATGMTGGIVGTGDTVTIELRLSEAVDITGNPLLKLNIGGQIVTATLASPQPKADVLTFTYTVAAGLLDANGISIPANAIDLNGGTVVSKDDGQSLIQLLDPLADNANYPVDSIAPGITGPSGGEGAATSAKAINENATAVHTFAANETATWSLSGTDAALFSISSTGALSFKAGPDFENPADANGDNSYVVEVNATDAAGNTSKQTVTITVNNIDEAAPVITGPSGPAVDQATISIPENQTAVTTFAANETVTWAISGGYDKAKFTINPQTGVLTLNTAPDFEAPTDFGTNNVYDVQIKATDASGNVSFQSLAVTVTDVDEIPPVTGPIDITAATDSGADDGLTNNGNPVLTFTGEPGLTIGLKGPDGTALVKDQHYTVAYDAVTGTYTVTLKDADPSDGTLDPFGTYDALGAATSNTASTADGIYTIVATDAANNSSNVGQFEIDTTVPDVGALDMTDATDSGASQSDEVTSNGNPVLTFDGEAGLVIGLKGPDGTPLEEGKHFTVDYTNGVYTVTLLDADPSDPAADPFGTRTALGAATGNSAATADGIYTITATDNAGNDTDVGTFTIDTAVDVGPLDINNATDSGANDDLTNNGNPVLTFTGEPGLTIGLEGPGGTPLVEGDHFTVDYTNGVYTVTLLDADPSSVTADPFGTYNGQGAATQNSAATADGVYTITATDEAGNGKDVGAFTIDTSAPATPVITNVTEDANDQTPTDLVTTDTTQVLTVTGQTGCTLKVYDSNGTLIDPATYTVTESVITPGTYTVDFGTTTLAAGNYSVKLTDAAGNESGASSPFTIETPFGVVAVIYYNEYETFLAAGDTLATQGSVTGSTILVQFSQNVSTRTNDTDPSTITWDFDGGNGTAGDPSYTLARSADATGQAGELDRVLFTSVNTRLNVAIEQKTTFAGATEDTVDFAAGTTLSLSTNTPSAAAEDIIVQYHWKIADGGGSFTGGSKDDWIIGGTGADTITGGGGADILTGGAGTDTFGFAYGQAEGATITDFTAGVGGDVIDFLGTEDLTAGSFFGPNNDLSLITTNATSGLLENGMNILTGVTANSTSMTDIETALQSFGDIDPFARFYIALNVADSDPNTIGNQAGAIIVRYDNTQNDSTLHASEMQIVAILNGVDAANLTSNNFIDFTQVI